MITFAIVGHDEADTVAAVLAMALDAAGPDDRVLFVDSASTDDTASVAKATGVEVLMGPIGKGAAMAVAVAAARTEWLCFLDADMTVAGANIAERLRAAVLDTTADHLVGDFTDPFRGVLSNTVAIYEPLVAGLFPEVAGKLGSKPLSGFRAVRRRYIPADLPPDYGVEAALNIELTLAGAVSQVIPIGDFSGKFKPHPTMAVEIARAVLDEAELHGRLDRRQRPAYEEWVATARTAISVTKVPDPDKPAYIDRLRAAAAAPLPPPFPG